MEANTIGGSLDPIIDLELWESLRNPNFEPRNLRTLREKFNYQLVDGKLYRIVDGELRYVPTIGERELLVKHLHYISSHAGIPRTIALIIG